MIAFCLNLSAQETNIIPQPVKLALNPTASPFTIDYNTLIIAPDSLINSISFLQNYLTKYYGITVNRDTTFSKATNKIKLIINNIKTANHDRYELTSNSKEVQIVASSSTGIFYGIQTLIQLLPYSSKAFPLQIPSVNITDYPRFDYRGMHLDVSRHFFDVAFVKKYIDYLALHKMNYFHWHLTDDHGWRIEIKKYPKLTEIGAWRNGSIIGLWPGKGNEDIKYQVLPTEIKITPKDATIKTDGIRYGGFYTQEQIKDVIDYASKRYITIIP